MLNNFIYAQEKSLFLEQLGAGNILDEAIVFIEDTGEIWNHGTYFAGDCGFDPEVIREIQTAVANLKASKQDAISDLATIRIGASAGATAVQPETLNNYVPTNRTINGKSLTNNISLSASDVGAPAIGELNTTNTNVSDLTSKVSNLTTDYSAFKQVFSDNSDEYINTWGEVKNFLDGIKNTEDLNAILLGINTELGKKANKATTLAGYGITDGIKYVNGIDLANGVPHNEAGYGYNQYGWKSNGPALSIGTDGHLMLLQTSTADGQLYHRYIGGDYKGAWYKILHAGNIRDYAFSPQTQITNNTDADTLLTNGVYLNATGNGSGNSNFPSEYSILMTFTQDKNYSTQISVGNNSMHVRRKIDAWSDWKTVAFTDSDITGNAASATKLQTARSLWGNSFDGTADVSGNLTLSNNSDINGLASDGTSVALMSVGSDDIVRIASGAFYQQKATRLYGESLAFYTATTPSLLINSAGSVLIGKDTSTGEKLQVNGEITVPNNSYYKITDTSGATLGIAKLTTSNVLSFGYETAYYTGYDTHLYGKNIKFVYGMGNSTVVGMTLNESGYVGIGTTAPQAKLDVNGNVGFNGTLTLPINHQVQWGNSGLMMYGSSTALTLVGNTEINGTAKIYGVANLSSRLLVNGATDDGITALQVNGDIHVTGDIRADGQLSSTGRFRINTSNSVNSFGFLKATAYTDALNRSVMHIGSNYGGTSTLTSETMDVVAMSMYRGVLGVGKEYTYDELYANYNSAISLMVANSMSVKGSTYVNGNITTNSNIGIGTAAPTQKLDVRGNQYITGYIYADGDLHTGQWLKTSTGVAFGSAHTLTFNSYSIISNAELSFTNISTTDISTGIKAAIKAGMIQANDIIGHRIFLGNNSAGTVSNQAFSICKYGSVVDTAPSNITELLKVDPSGAVTINGSLSVTGNIISSDEYLGASNVLDNPEYASYPSSGSSMEIHSDIRNFVNNGTVVRKDGKLYVKDNPFAPVTTHWLDIFSDPTEIGGYNYSGPIELDLYPDRFYDFTNSLFISSIKINSIPGWDNPGLISHNIVRFRPTNTAFSLTLPSDIYWADGKPFEVDDNNAVYEMSFIVRNGGVITATWTKFTQA